MIKFTTAILISLFSQALLAYEVPVKLINLLKSSKEQIYVGQNCEMRAYQDNEGFHIAAYERDGNGNIDKSNYGKFTLNKQHELDDFWDYSNGFEAVSYFRSPLGSSFDLKSKILVQKFSEKSLVEIVFQRSNGLFLYTFYHFECELGL